MGAAGAARAALPVAALFALAVPVLVGLAWMAWAGSPESYRILNAAALGFASIWLVFARAPNTVRQWRILAIAALFALCLPFLTGPGVNGVARWISFGPVGLNSGAIAIPALAVAAVRDRAWGPHLLGAALLPLTAQPDAAAGLAVTFAAVGIHDRTKDWRYGIVCIAGFFLTISMALRGELPPQTFVERVIGDAMGESLVWAVLLFGALAASFFTVLKGLRADAATSYALAGCLFGFIIMALVSHNPFPLIGYGAAPILGFGLALGLAESSRAG
ncbi:hypothetical protein [Erythrobacter litoralis]|uniref:hypothetical protein n=1 Tax=Erythrobacter litoralis TaxID=39960 RepID=UPI00243569FD|nr:hypothetical protein [Erythrobacter litoralis]